MLKIVWELQDSNAGLNRRLSDEGKLDHDNLLLSKVRYGKICRVSRRRNRLKTIDFDY